MGSRRRPGRADAAVPALVASELEAEPVVAVDVGAARGIPPHWRPFIDVLRVNAFEPRQDECARLAATSHPNITWHPVSLAGAVGPRQLHVLAVPTGSSLLPPDEAFAARYGEPDYLRVVEVVDLACTTLGEQLADQPSPILIKLDTQGTELEILQGLSAAQRAGVQAIEVEAEFHTVYRGQPLFADIHAYLTGEGFELFDLRTQRTHFTGGVENLHYLRRELDTAVGTRQLSAKLHAADALYLRPFEQVVETVTAGSFARFATILQIYRAYDAIFWLLDQPPVAELFGVQGGYELASGYRDRAPRPRFIQRTGPVPLALRRGLRVLSLGSERFLGGDGFYPPRTAWSHSFWPDQ
jgi:FkbM family methyltransferase